MQFPVFGITRPYQWHHSCATTKSRPNRCLTARRDKIVCAGNLKLLLPKGGKKSSRNSADKNTGRVCNHNHSRLHEVSAGESMFHNSGRPDTPKPLSSIGILTKPNFKRERSLSWRGQMSLGLSLERLHISGGVGQEGLKRRVVTISPSLLARRKRNQALRIVAPSQLQPLNGNGTPGPVAPKNNKFGRPPTRHDFFSGSPMVASPESFDGIRHMSTGSGRRGSDVATPLSTIF